MKCPSCSQDTSVTETRSVASGVRRRRRCECGARFTTVEVMVSERTRFNERMVLVDQRKAVAALHALELELTP